MAIHKTIPTAIITAVVALLQPHFERLTAEKLFAALRERDGRSDEAVDAAKSLSPKQAGKRLGVSTRTVWNMIERGDLRKFNPTRRLARIPLADIEALEARAK